MLNEQKHRYLKITEDGKMMTFDDIDPETVKEFDEGIIDIVDMVARQSLSAITRGGFRWEFIERKSDTDDS